MRKTRSIFIDPENKIYEGQRHGVDDLRPKALQNMDVRLTVSTPGTTRRQHRAPGTLSSVVAGPNPGPFTSETVAASSAWRPGGGGGRACVCLATTAVLARWRRFVAGSSAQRTRWWMRPG